MELSEAQIQSRQRASAGTRTNIDAEIAIACDNIWDAFRGFVWNISHRYTQFHHPIILYEFDLHDLWYMLIEGAKNTSANHPSQDRLVVQVLAARELGNLTWTPPAEDQKEAQPQYAQTSHGKIWADLPFLSADVQEAWSKALEFSPSHRHNLAAFIARLAKLGICNNALSICGLSLLREALETPRRLMASESGSEVPVAELLPAVNSWLEHAGHKLIALSSDSYNEFPHEAAGLGELARKAEVSPSGFSPSRWRFWRQRLEEISKCGEEQVAKDGSFGFNVMSQMVRDIESVMKEKVGDIYRFDPGQFK